jgi:hypothetical protein
MLILQNCRDLEKCVRGPYGEMYPRANHDANHAMNIKVEDVLDVEVGEEHPVPITFTAIKSEHEVSWLSLCTPLGTFHAQQELAVVSLNSVSLSVDTALASSRIAEL